MFVRVFLSFSLCIFISTTAGCGEELLPGEVPLQVASRCPGPGCLDEGDGVFYAGGGKRDITPKVETFVDANANGRYDAGETFVDMNGNGTFDAYWIAGFDNGRLALGIHDPTWARAWVLKYNQTTIAFVTVDTVGFFLPDLESVRALLDPSLGVDLVVASSTHVHETADTVGIWGPTLTEPGVNAGYMSEMRQKMAEAITDAAQSARPASLKAGSILVEDEGGDTTAYVSDTRDPVVIDNRLHVLEFDDATTGAPIVAMVNWSAHPESAGSDNQLISSDFVHWVRQEAELTLGCDVVYVNGSLGGQIGPGRVVPHPVDGVQPKKKTFEFAEAIGRGVGAFVARAMDPAKGGDVVTESAPRLEFRVARFPVHVENVYLITAGELGLIPRDFYGADENKPKGIGNAPIIDTEMAYIRIGEHVSIMTMPGELLPELFIGGYDGSAAKNWLFIDESELNAPPVMNAPKPPYLRDIMDGAAAHRMIFGLTQDFLGYIVPQYNFVVEENAAYVLEAAGDHYEETRALGPLAEPELVGTARQLVLAR